MNLSHISDVLTLSARFDVRQLLRIEEELGNVRYAGQSFRKPL